MGQLQFSMGEEYMRILCVLCLVSGLSAAPPLKSAGCKTEYFLIQELAQGFLQAGGSEIKAGRLGNKKAISLLSQNQIDFAFCCKPFSKLAKKFAIDPAISGQWKEMKIAKDPIVLVSHPGNGIQSLTMAQIKGIFTGSITQWQAIGGAELPIEIIVLDDTVVESGVVTVFRESTIGEDADITGNVTLLGDPQKIGLLTASKPGAIGLMGLNSYKESYGTLLSVDGVVPNKDHILDGSYPIAATYYLIWDQTREEGVAPFLTFVQSQAGQQLINQQFVTDF
jgi:phosphate transport system substrate-binding protein